MGFSAHSLLVRSCRRTPAMPIHYTMIEWAAKKLGMRKRGRCTYSIHTHTGRLDDNVNTMRPNRASARKGVYMCSSVVSIYGLQTEIHTTHPEPETHFVCAHTRKAFGHQISQNLWRRSYCSTGSQLSPMNPRPFEMCTLEERERQKSIQKFFFSLFCSHVFVSVTYLEYLSARPTSTVPNWWTRSAARFVQCDNQMNKKFRIGNW